jgi:hypothetical protein
MAFHETFWVVVGTAAPVIALACVVSMSDGLGSFASFTRSIRRVPKIRRTMLWLAALGGINFANQGVMLFVALFSLAVGKDEGDLLTSVLLTTGGIVLLFVTTFENKIMQIRAARLKERAPSPGELPASAVEPGRAPKVSPPVGTSAASSNVCPVDDAAEPSS